MLLCILFHCQQIIFTPFTLPHDTWILKVPSYLFIKVVRIWQWLIISLSFFQICEILAWIDENIFWKYFLVSFVGFMQALIFIICAFGKLTLSSKCSSTRGVKHRTPNPSVLNSFKNWFGKIGGYQCSTDSFSRTQCENSFCCIWIYRVFQSQILQNT